MTFRHRDVNAATLLGRLSIIDVIWALFLYHKHWMFALSLLSRLVIFLALVLIGGALLSRLTLSVLGLRLGTIS